MKKRKGNSLRKIMAGLISVVMIAGMASGAAPMKVYAAENTETENVDGSDPFDGAESETTDITGGTQEEGAADITGELPEGAAGETTIKPAEESTEEDNRSGDTVAFEIFYENIKARSIYDTGVEAQFGDTFLTCSACGYHVENGRFVVVARRRE